MRSPVAFVVVCLLAAAPVAADPVRPQSPQLPAVLALDDALRLFHAHGLDVLIADAAVQNAEGQILINGAVPNPVASVSVGNAIGYDSSTASQQNCMQNGSVCSPWSSSISVSDSAAISDSISGKRDLRLRVARNALAAAKLSRVDAERSLVFQVKSTYAQVAQATLALKFARDVASSQVETLRKFRDLYRLGTANEMNLNLIEVQKLEADQAVDQAEQALRTARAALAFLLGVRGAVPDFEVVTDTLKFAVPAQLASTTELALLQDAFAFRPDLAALGYQRQSAREQVRLVRRQRVPDVTLGLTYSFGGFGGFSTNGPIQGQSIALSASLPIPIFYSLAGEQRQARAQLATTTLQEAKQTAQVADDITTAWAAFNANKRLVARMEGRWDILGVPAEPRGILDAARSAWVHAEQNLRTGNIQPLDYLNALRTYIATKNEYYNDLASYWTAVYQLEAAVAKDLRR
jgi:cobalt-zinc-cadmium efflux system outer membrane protein